MFSINSQVKKVIEEKLEIVLFASAFGLGEREGGSVFALPPAEPVDKIGSDIFKYIPMQPKVLVIVGATASGKSALAVDCARKFNGEVVSADSRQVYKGLDIGSGKITKKEMMGVRHHLLGIASPKTVFTVSQYRAKAERVISKIIRSGKLPIICGGTGFYIDALIFGYGFPSVKPNPRLRKALENKSLPSLLSELKRIDARRFRAIDKKNKRRIIRAIEIAQSLGKVPVLSVAPRYDALFIGIKIPQEKLKKRIEKRLLLRLKKGMIEEVQSLMLSGVSFKRLHELGLEYRAIAMYLRGKMKKREMIAHLKKEIARFAKRQMTWFRRNKKIIWTEDREEACSRVRDWLAP